MRERAKVSTAGVGSGWPRACTRATAVAVVAGAVVEAMKTGW